jgi:hypothetical protein
MGGGKGLDDNTVNSQLPTLSEVEGWQLELTADYLSASRLLKMSSLTLSGSFIPLIVTKRGRVR